jgi:hypothetical protein
MAVPTQAAAAGLATAAHLSDVIIALNCATAVFTCAATFVAWRNACRKRPRRTNQPRKNSQ